MFKRTIYLAICLGFILSTGLSDANAQVANQERIGYVNPNTILQKMPEMKAIQQRLQNFVQKKQDELAQKQQDLRDQISEYQQRQSVISDDAQKQEEARLGKLQAELQQAEQQAQQDIQQKQQELVGPLFEEINKSINAVAQEMGLSYVLNTVTNDGSTVILYASDEAQQKYDITNEVMDNLGIGQ